MRRKESSKSAGLRWNEREKKVFWTLFAALAGIVLAQVVDPATVQQIVGMIIRM
jgi:hypothetical protein